MKKVFLKFVFVDTFKKILCIINKDFLDVKYGNFHQKRVILPYLSRKNL